ncbi:MAG: hypothetical protein OXN25_18260 [Candidatus Poribacteria bacterium]|nr:hypothetical protein [Candidatus Poribacteria bacterium]
MNNKQSPYRAALTTFPMVVVLLCCITFLGCPETTEIVDDVIQPTSIDPGRTERADEPTTSPPEEEPVGGPDTPTTPPPDAEVGGGLDEPTAPADPDDTPVDPNEAPDAEATGAGGLGG